MMSDDLLGRTKTLWEPRYGRKLSDEEAREIARNVVGLFTILEEWASSEDDGARTSGTTDEESPGR